MHHRRRGRPEHHVVRIGRAAVAVVAAFLLSHAGCGLRDHNGIPGHAGATGTGIGGTGNVGSPGSAGASGVAGTTGSGGNDTSGTGGDATGVGGNATGTAGGAGTAGATGAAGSGNNAGTAGASGAAGATGSGGDATGSGGNTGAGGSGAAGNLITNGDFSAGSENWHTESGNGNVNNGAYCVGSPGSGTLVGWAASTGTMLSLSGSYKVSFQASGGGTVHLKVGMAVSPYGSDFESNDGVGNSLQTFTHTFTANDDNAGLAFTFMNAGTSTVCIDNVTLTAN